MADRLTLEQLTEHSPDLARVCGAGFVDAYQGEGGLYAVYTSGSSVFLSALRDGPTPVHIEDLGWTTEFAVPAAKALASGIITAHEEDGALLVSEEDSDKAWDAENERDAPAPVPSGLLERWLKALPWGQPHSALDLQVRAAGVWNTDNTELILILDKAFEPFQKLTYTFKDQKLASVNTRTKVTGPWKAMQFLESALRRHVPGAEWWTDAGEQWSLEAARPQLEGKDDAKVQLRTDLNGALLVAVATAHQHEGKQSYGLVVICFAPRP